MQRHLVQMLGAAQQHIGQRYCHCDSGVSEESEIAEVAADALASMVQ
jgi:hypothetical protein